MSATDQALQHDISQFLYREAQLLDAGDLTEWLTMLSPDIRYRVPCFDWRLAGARPSAPGEFDHFDDDLAGLRVRVRRMTSSLSWTEHPRPMTRRVIGNVIVAQDGSSGRTVADSVFSLWLYRSPRDHQLFVGARRDVLVTIEGQWRLAERLVHLDQTVATGPLFMLF